MEAIWIKAARVFSVLDLIWNIVLLVYILLGLNLAAPDFLFSKEELQFLLVILCTIQIYAAARLFIATLSETLEVDAIRHIKLWNAIYISFTILYFIGFCGLLYFNTDVENILVVLKYGAGVLFGRVAAIFLVLKLKTDFLKKISSPDEMLMHKNNNPVEFV